MLGQMRYRNIRCTIRCHCIEYSCDTILYLQKMTNTSTLNFTSCVSYPYPPSPIYPHHPTTTVPLIYPSVQYKKKKKSLYSVHPLHSLLVYYSYQRTNAINRDVFNIWYLMASHSSLWRRTHLLCFLPWEGSLWCLSVQEGRGERGGAYTSRWVIKRWFITWAVLSKTEEIKYSVYLLAFLILLQFRIV